MSNVSARKSIGAMAPIIEEIVRGGGSVRLGVKGTSMMPLLRSEKDAVLLVKPDNLRRFDVVLFKKADGRIALHRIVGLADTLTIIGDNQYSFDRKIPKSDLIAKATEFHRGKHKIGERKIRAFGAVWFALYPIRRISRKGIIWIRNRLSACMRFLRSKFR